MPVLDDARREKFAQELATGKTATEAYILAGYAPNDGNCCRLKQRPDVRGRVDEIQGRAAKRAEVSVERILRELALIGFANMSDFIRIGEDGDPYYDLSELTADQAAALSEVTVEDFKEGRGENARDVRRIKLKLADKRAALVDMGRHLGMFKDRTVLENPDGTAVTPNPVVIFQLPDNGRAG